MKAKKLFYQLLSQQKLIGEQKDVLHQLKIKDNVDLAGLSQQQEV